MWPPSSPEHRRSVDPERLGEKDPSNSRVQLALIMSAADSNLYGTVHGGVIMKLVDDAAGAAAARHAGGPAVTASVDRMTFLNPAHVGDLVRVDATVARVGRTSLEVVVEVEAERWNAPGSPRRIVRSFLTMVAVDDDGRPRPVPALILRTPQDVARDREAQEARERREARD